MKQNLNNHPTCATCRWFEPTAAFDVPRPGMCCRNAPTPLMVGMARTALGQQPLFNGVFPPVNSDCWCGQHVPLLQAEAT